MAGEYSRDLGEAYVALARALFARGKDADARAACRSGVEHFQRALGQKHPETRSAQQLGAISRQAVK